MKIIRWLLSHTILILLIVTVIYGYMFWGNLLGEDTPAGKTIAYLSEEFEEVAEFVNAVKAKQAKRQQQTASNPAQVAASESEVQVESQPETSVLVVNAKEDVVQTETEASNIEQKPVSISYSHNDMRVEQNSDGYISAVREIATDQTAVSPITETFVSNVESSNAPESFVSVEVEEKLDNLDDQGKVIDVSKNETLRESWIVARKSFYQRNYQQSEQSYLKVIDASENNHDAYGELGNVYFNQGKNEQAASAYYEAAAILVRQGQKSRARSLMGLLRYLDKSKAVKLKRLLDTPA
ncbi:hypothetical protein MNBD_GAMMA05-2378 [hydrothermal vent metagenome]|uniref:Uncharacterized protein n=1 Tax=hydrothermal vent metagenome TaxID=652676 RepID=A0A3B0XGZ9_9ZZZZ